MVEDGVIAAQVPRLPAHFLGAAIALPGLDRLGRLARHGEHLVLTSADTSLKKTLRARLTRLRPRVIVQGFADHLFERKLERQQSSSLKTYSR